MRYQDSENVLNSNGRSESYHLAGTVNKHGVRQEFCTKFDSNDGTGDWPTGQYCIYRYGPTCPQGLIEGWSWLISFILKFLCKSFFTTFIFKNFYENV